MDAGQRAELGRLKAATSLAAVIGETLPLKRAGRFMVALCPFRRERMQSFNVFTNHYHCFGCGAQGQSETAAMAMFNAWLERRWGGTGAAETAEQFDCVRSALVQHGAGRFTLLRPIPGHSEGWQEEYPDRPVQNRIGWRKRDGVRDEFLIPAETWRSEICAPAMLDPIATARALAKASFSRRDGKNLTVNERLPGFSRPVRVYAVSATLLEADEDKTDAATVAAASAATESAL